MCNEKAALNELGLKQMLKATAERYGHDSHLL